MHPLWALRVMSNLVRNTLRRLDLLRSTRRVVKEFGADLVHCMNLDTLHIGYLTLGRGRFVYDSREHFATTGNVSRMTRRWWMAKESFLIRRAAGVLTVSPPIAECRPAIESQCLL